MSLLELLFNKKKLQFSKSLERQAREGHQAGELLRDGLFSQIINDMRTKIIEEWRSAPLRDLDGQHELKLMLKVLDDIVKNIEQSYLTGEMAKKQLAQENDKERML